MPKHPGASNKAREANIKEEIHSGKPIKQAVAIGYSEQNAAKARYPHQKRGRPHPTKGSHEA